MAVEFEEPVDQIAPPPRPPTPIPEPPPTLTTDLMVPEGFLSQPQRQTTGFQAFQGEGRLLGGSNVNIPEWRRGLPPPKR